MSRGGDARPGEEVVGVADGPMAPAAGPQALQPVLSGALAAMMDEVHALSGGVYLLAHDQAVLEMAAMAGLPRVFAAPWERVGLSAPIPIAQAVRDRRLVWVGDEEDMARRYPRVAVVVPYPFALAAVPVASAHTMYGGVFVTWPGSLPPQPPHWIRERLTAACARLATRLARSARRTPPQPAAPGPPAAAPRADVTGPPVTAEAARMVARLSYGLVSLDLRGRITFANEAAGELLGTPAGELLGTRLPASVPWLNDSGYEDRYRAALFSQRTLSFLALRPPGTWLSFQLYPDTTGLSLCVSRTVAEPPHGAPVSARPGLDRLVGISTVLNLTGALAEATGVQDVVQLVADEIGPTVGSAALVLLGSQGGRLQVLGHRGYPDPRFVEGFDGLPLNERTPGTQALYSGVPGFYESREQLDQVYPNRPQGPDTFAAWAFLPLIASGRTVGLCVLAYDAPRVFPPEERALLSSLAGLTAQALERALLYDTKNQLAHDLQEVLLPHSLAVLPGIEAAACYVPATRGMDIGGDFYDLVPARPLPAAVIGDVQGHNVTAAGLMGQIRTAVRAYTTVGQPPQEVMRGTNRLLVDLDAGLFASCLYLRLDRARERAVMARAGHPPPLLRRPDGRVRVLDLAGGPLLGIDASARYPTTEVSLAPGSVLALYTDGLVESPEADIEDSLADLGALLAEIGDRPLRQLADELVRHSTAAREQADDVAVLLLRARAE